MQVIVSLFIGMLKSYLVKLASKEFLHWAFFEIAEAVVNNTKTKEDDKWLVKIKETIEK